MFWVKHHLRDDKCRTKPDRAQQRSILQSNPTLGLAMESFEHAVELDPDFALAWVGIAESATLLEAHGTLNPNYATTYHWYSILISNTNDRLQESLDLINKAAELDPLSPIIKQNIAMIYGRMGRFTEQESTFRQLFSADPELSLIHEDPRFKAMDQRACAELARQRENLAYLAPAVHRFPR